MSRRHVIVSGRVQGVWFRDSMRREAERLALAGWVRNLPDGRVEAVFEGPADAVEHLTDWCRHGPPGACVTSVVPREEPPEGLTGFRIVR
jgi:acylphosphatase